MPGGSSFYNVLSMGGKMKEIFQRRKFNSLLKKMSKHNINTKEWNSVKNQLFQYCEKVKHTTFSTGSKNYDSRIVDINLDGVKTRVMVLPSGRAHVLKDKL